MKKLVLTYPPYSVATSPPLGVCSLKGFIQRRLSEWSVKVVDLNLIAHRGLFQQIARQPQFVGAGLDDVASQHAALLRAAETFRGEHDEEFYDQPHRYFLYSQHWLGTLPTTLAPDQLLQQGYQNDVLPPVIRHYADLILREQPTMVGISSCYSSQLWPALCLAKAIRQRSSIPIILGGTCFNSGVDESWAAHRGVIDYVVSGEGEWPLLHILSGDADSQPVPGVIRLKDGQLTSAPVAVENDLDALGEPDFSDLDLRAYYSPKPVIPMLTSRGCYWRRCAFCVHYKSAGLTYRRRSIAAVIDELRHHVANGVGHFALIDEMIAPARFSQLADAILAAGLDVHYYALAKPARQFDRELLGRMYKSGCRYILWGVESGCQRILDLIDKGTTVPENEQMLAAAHEAGIRNHVFIFSGFPTETREEFQLTLDFLTRNKAVIDSVHRGPFQLEKDSIVYDHPERFSITRSWLRPGGNVYDYECNAGMTPQQARQALSENMLFLRSFASSTPQLGDFRFRDHALLLYSRQDAARRF